MQVHWVAGCLGSPLLPFLATCTFGRGDMPTMNCGLFYCRGQPRAVGSPPQVRLLYRQRHQHHHHYHQDHVIPFGLPYSRARLYATNATCSPCWLCRGARGKPHLACTTIYCTDAQNCQSSWFHHGICCCCGLVCLAQAPPNPWSTLSGCVHPPLAVSCFSLC